MSRGPGCRLPEQNKANTDKNLKLEERFFGTRQIDEALLYLGNAEVLRVKCRKLLGSVILQMGKETQEAESHAHHPTVTLEHQ